MTTCLSAVRIQAAADERATHDEAQHLALCADCRARVDATRRAIHEFGRTMDVVPVPPSLAEALAGAVARTSAPDAAHAATTRRGATTLLPGRSGWLRPVWISAAGAVAAAALVIGVVLPALDSPATISAAEILDRSIGTLAPSGTERLEYELTIEAPADWLIESGTYRIDQVIEHDGARRWRMSRSDAGGTLLNGISENPRAQQRHTYVRLDGQGYVFDFTTVPGAALPLPEMQRQFGETAIRIVRNATANVVSTVAAAEGPQFLITLPEAAGGSSPAGAAAVWDVTGARVLVDAHDYHVVEFSLRARYLRQPVHVSYRLLHREVRPSSQVPPEEFELPVDPSAIHLAAEGTRHPPRDVVAALLREVRAIR